MSKLATAGIATGLLSAGIATHNYLKKRAIKKSDDAAKLKVQQNKDMDSEIARLQSKTINN